MKSATLLLLFLLTGSGTLQASALPSGSLDNDILRLLSMIENGQIDEAYDFSSTLYRHYPGAAAITLMFADLQNVSAGGHVAMDPRDKFSRPLLEVLDELRIRKQQARDTQHVGKMPAGIIQAHPATQHIIAVDLSLSRLYLLERVENSEQFVVAEYHYISIGRGGIGKVDEGDLKTPVGLYRIDGFREDKELPELYGFGAFTLDFPNALDRRNGFDGYGIWLHGVPHNQTNRPPLTSEGCVVMRNDLVEHLLSTIDRANTPVILAESLEWTDSPQADTQVQNLLGHLKEQHFDAIVPPSAAVPAPHRTEGTLQVATRGLQGLLGDLINPVSSVVPGLEILRYPAHPHHSNKQHVFRVSFLQSNTPGNNDDPVTITQFWQHSNTAGWVKILDSVSP